MSLRERLHCYIPSRKQIFGNRWLAWLGPWLHDPKLWHWSRRGVALGVALGVFFGLLVPIAQIPLTVAAAIVMRANVPVAAASTLITNPITFGPIYYGAYRLGAWVTGEDVPVDSDNNLSAQKIGAVDDGASLWQRIVGLGKPLLVGGSVHHGHADWAFYLRVDHPDLAMANLVQTAHQDALMNPLLTSIFSVLAAVVFFLRGALRRMTQTDWLKGATLWPPSSPCLAFYLAFNGHIGGGEISALADAQGEVMRRHKQTTYLRAGATFGSGNAAWLY